jgi:hypothetical protein
VIFFAKHEIFLLAALMLEIVRLLLVNRIDD